MPAGAAGGDVDLAERAELGVADLHFFQIDAAAVERNATECGVADRTWLLMNLFEHEMLEAALFRHDRIPGNVLDLALDRAPVEIGELHAGWRDHSEIAVAEEEEVARVIEDRGHVAGDEVFILAEADYCRRAIARGDDLVLLVR